jgi:hypothetical protein
MSTTTQLLTSPKILSDAQLRKLLRMYWTTDICKMTGLKSPALRLFLTGHTETLKSKNARILSDFVWTHYLMMCSDFGNTPDGVKTRDGKMFKYMEGEKFSETMYNFRGKKD